jgi:cell division protein FtsQ
MLLAAGAAVLLLALAAFAWAGPLLVVRSVDVHGVTGERAQQVRSAAQAPFGEPLLQVDAGALAERVRRLPFVADVEVRRGWPRTLVVTVEARTPRAAVPAPGGGYELVDGTGVAYARASKVPRGLPVIRLADGAPADQRQPTLVAALAVLERLPHPVGSKVTAVRAASPDAVTLTVSGKTVVWGSAADTERKARIFSALRHTKAKVYDVSSPDTPVLR